MSSKIFEAIDERKSEGLEAVLYCVINTAEEEKDYSTAAEARYHIRRAQFGLPIDFDADSEKGKELMGYSKSFSHIAATAYRKEGKFNEAAGEFSNAGMYKEAIEMYQGGDSDDALGMASFLAINHKVDIKLGIDLRIQRNPHAISRTLDDLSRFEIEERQKWQDYAVKAFYDSIGEQLESIDSYLREGLMRPVLTSSDSEVLDIGIKLNELRSRDPHLSEGDKGFIKDREMFLRGKLTGSDEYTNYFIQQADQSGDRSIVDCAANQAIEIFEHHKKYGVALEVADRFLSPADYVRIKLLKRLGETEKLAAAYREVDNPIDYALTVTGESPKTI